MTIIGWLAIVFIAAVAVRIMGLMLDCEIKDSSFINGVIYRIILFLWAYTIMSFGEMLLWAR